MYGPSTGQRGSVGDGAVGLEGSLESPQGHVVLETSLTLTGQLDLPLIAFNPQTEPTADHHIGVGSDMMLWLDAIPTTVTTGYLQWDLTSGSQSVDVYCYTGTSEAVPYWNLAWGECCCCRA